MMNEKKLLQEILTNNPVAIQEFFFVRCKDIFSYIGQFFCDGKTSEEIIGEAYEVLSADDWHKLRIFKGTCKLTTYVTVIMSRYFQHQRDRLKKVDENTLIKQGGKIENECSVVFLLSDIRKTFTNFNLLDQTLIQRILLDGEKPRDVMEEIGDLIRDEEGESFVAEHTPKQLAGYVYTRYSRVKTKFQNYLREYGYGE